MDILDDMGVSKLSAKVFFKVNYFFNLKIVLSCTQSFMNGKRAYCNLHKINKLPLCVVLYCFTTSVGSNALQK